MKGNILKNFLKIRRMEEEIAYATPPRAAKLTSKIVRMKNALFDAGDNTDKTER